MSSPLFIPCELCNLKQSKCQISHQSHVKKSESIAQVRIAEDAIKCTTDA